MNFILLTQKTKIQKTHLINNLLKIMQVLGFLRFIKQKYIEVSKYFKVMVDQPRPRVFTIASVIFDLASTCRLLRAVG